MIHASMMEIRKLVDNPPQILTENTEKIST